MKTPFRVFLLPLTAGIVFLFGASLGSATAQSAATQTSGTSQSTKSASKKAVAKAPPSAQDIADAKSKGMVWVNTSTRVYHTGSSSLYGTTKHGKFMSEDDAKKAGYRAAADEPGVAKKRSASKTTSATK